MGGRFVLHTKSFLPKTPPLNFRKRVARKPCRQFLDLTAGNGRS
jgi:hypothetical protein